MSEYFNLTIADWFVGTDGLSLEQEAAYFRVVCAINLYDQPISFNYRVLCGLWRCNERKAKRLLGELIEAGKLSVNGASIHNRRAVDDVSKRRELRVKRQSSGHSGGVQSGKARRNPLKDNDQEEAIASPKSKVNKREGEDIGSGGKPPPPTHAHARGPEPSPSSEPEPEIIDLTKLRDRVLDAAGIDITKSRKPARWLGSEPIYTIRQWLDLGLTDEEIIEVTREVIAEKTDGPPSSLGYFNVPMQRRAGLKARPALTPIEGGKQHDEKSARERRAEQELKSDLEWARDLDAARERGG